MVGIFNYLGEYFQLPWGVFSITLGSIFNYPREYFQLPWGAFSTILGSIFIYPEEYQEAAGWRLGFLGAKETPPKIEVPKVLCFTMLEPATTHFAAEWRR